MFWDGDARLALVLRGDVSLVLPGTDWCSTFVGMHWCHARRIGIKDSEVDVIVHPYQDNSKKTCSSAGDAATSPMRVSPR